MRSCMQYKKRFDECCCIAYNSHHDTDMQVQLTITQSPSLDIESLRKFVALSKSKGKTPEGYLTELIVAALASPLKTKNARKTRRAAK